MWIIGPLLVGAVFYAVTDYAAVALLITATLTGVAGVVTAGASWMTARGRTSDECWMRVQKLQDEIIEQGTELYSTKMRHLALLEWLRARGIDVSTFESTSDQVYDSSRTNVGDVS